MKAVLHYYETEPDEQRRFQSVKVALAGRYMLQSKDEFACEAIEMSPGDIRLRAPVKPMIGEHVVVYLDDLGRFAGPVERETEEGFVLSMSLPTGKRDKLADQLIWFANRHVVGLPEDRRHERIVPLMRRAMLRLDDRSEIIVKILDISVSGVGVETDSRPPIGAHIVIGTTPAVVVRHFETGFASEFTKPFSPNAVNESMRL